MPTMLYDATKQHLKTSDWLPCGDLVSVFPKDSPVIVVETSAVKPRHGKAKTSAKSNSITRSTKKPPKTKAGDRKLSVTKPEAVSNVHLTVNEGVAAHRGLKQRPLKSEVDKEKPRSSGDLKKCANPGCHNPVKAKRSDAKYCSNRCKTAHCRVAQKRAKDKQGKLL